MDRDLRELERKVNAGDLTAIGPFQAALKRVGRSVKITKKINSRTFGVRVLQTFTGIWHSYCDTPRIFCKHQHKKKKAAISCAKRRAFKLFIETNPLLWAEYVGLIDCPKPGFAAAKNISFSTHF